MYRGQSMIPQSSSRTVSLMIIFPIAQPDRHHDLWNSKFSTNDHIACVSERTLPLFLPFDSSTRFNGSK
jgi:hypothetical protein